MLVCKLSSSRFTSGIDMIFNAIVVDKTCSHALHGNGQMSKAIPFLVFTKYF